MTYEKKRVLLTVKAYPEKCRKFGACVCTAGITDDGELVRLYPIPFESFRAGKKIPRYSWITVECEKASEYLNRKESYKVRNSTLKVEETVSTGPKRSWGYRNGIVLSLLSNSLEELQATTDNTSLGIIRPREITDLTIDPRDDIVEETDNSTKAVQFTLDGESRSELEIVPYNFRYHFYCNGENCRGHDIKCEDWEMVESWRSWKRKYQDKETLLSKFRQKYYEDMLTKDLHFFVGTHSMYNTWLIIGIYYPPKAN